MRTTYNGNQYRLTFVIATRNKIYYLKNLLAHLIRQIGIDEEIVVIDGGSKDGTAEYLRELYKEGKIEQYLSEPDFCQAHAYNKGTLLARGRVVKVLTDDDAYHLPTIRKCCDFLLENPDVDLLCGTIGDISKNEEDMEFTIRPTLKRYLEWRDGKGQAFWFGDQGMLIRKSSLPIVGLWHTGVWCIDVELSWRITSLKQAKLAWYSGIVACQILNRDSIQATPEHAVRNYKSYRLIREFYKGLTSFDVCEEDVKSTHRKAYVMRRMVRRMWRLVRDVGTRRKSGEKKTNLSKMERKKCVGADSNEEGFGIHEICVNWLEKYNAENPGSFYTY